MTNQEADQLLRRLRWTLGAFLVGLVLSGLTAFPLEQELDILVKIRGLDGGVSSVNASGLDHWILTVRDGLHDAYGRYPWLAYGTDWLAFAHLVIAVFFIGVFVDPVRNVWVVQAGLIACALVIPLALICGPLRGIPFGWRLIDCSFGVFGAIPLWICLRWIRRLEELQRLPPR
ncbi:MAG: hypothetical protein JNN07_14610 [Verrucomicrobiales bacterium]|nr:hypothetical protein [Verrucomicrobiales bacterium]